MKKTIFFTCSSLLAGILLAFFVLQMNVITQLAYRAAKAQDELLELKVQTAALQSGTSHISSPADLEQLAADFQFKKAQWPTYLRVPKGAVAQSQ